MNHKAFLSIVVFALLTLSGASIMSSALAGNRVFSVADDDDDDDGGGGGGDLLQGSATWLSEGTIDQIPGVVLQWTTHFSADDNGANFRRSDNSLKRHWRSEYSVKWHFCFTGIHSLPKKPEGIESDATR